MNLQIWNHVLQLAAERISKPSFETWLRSTELIDLNEESKHATVSAGNEFARDWIETRYKQLLTDLLFEATNTLYEISIISINPNLNSEKDDFELDSPSPPIKKVQIEQVDILNTDMSRDLLSKLLAEQKRTNELLEELVAMSRAQFK